MKTNHLSSFLKLAICAVVACSFVTGVKAADAKADGTWSWTMAGRNGGPERKLTLKLKTEGDKLTGKMISPGRDNQTNETEIADGKIKGNEVSFTVTREWGGNKMTSKYVGKVTADTIKGKIEFQRDGETQSRDWEAKREADKK